ncbi:hypothetical protein MTBLM1_60279 [Rhodospirillaceae bacterium LM-1]|nr:hypothetical protein MTBLM1_60279 [Rhodospirillaceae bacterium LM-1]
MAEGRSLFGKIRKALFKEKQEEALSEMAASSKSREEETWVALALDDLLKKHPRARLQVISLKDYRIAIGEAWATRANTIRMLSESTLRRHLSQGESCLSQGEDVFLMLMPGADEKESARRGYDAAVQLGQKLVGEKFSTGKVDGVAPDVRLANIALADMVNADGRVDVGAVLAAAEAAVSVKKIEGMGGPKGRLVEGQKPAAKDQWTMVAHERQSRPVEMLPIGQMATDRKKKAEPDWSPISKEK